MYFVSATRLRLRALWLLPAFFRSSEASMRELLDIPGFIAGRELADKGLVFWTLTIWHQDTDMKIFRNGTAHRDAMRHLPDWCTEGTYTHWLQPDTQLPAWQEVHQRMITEGMITKVRKPTDRHAARSFPLPKWKYTQREFKGRR